MNVYDFDKTIYPGDSSIHFWKFCLKKYPSAVRVLPKATVVIIKYKFGRRRWAEVMQTFFAFLKHIPSVEQAVEEFWDENIEKIYPWYLEKKKSDDVIISAAPDFLVSVACRRLGISCIATDMDPRTGIISGEEYSGEEKLKKYIEAYKNTPIDEFYSDSFLDTPLAEKAKSAFMVNKGKVSPWRFATD